MKKDRHFLFCFIAVCLLLLTCFFLRKSPLSYDRSMDLLEYMIVLRFDEQADYLYILSDMLKDPSIPSNEVIAFIRGASVFKQTDALRGAYDIVFDGDIPDYISQMGFIFSISEDKLSTMSIDERENLADICLELSALYDRNNVESSISWFILKKDYENPKLILLGNRATTLIEQICT